MQFVENVLALTDDNLRKVGALVPHGGPRPSVIVAPPNGLTEDERGGLFASQSWRDALTATYGFNILASSVADGTATGAAILFAEVNDILGPRLISLPFSDYVDPVVSRREDWDTLVSPLLSAGVPIRMRILRNTVPRDDRRFSQRVAGLWHGVDLTRPVDAMWKSLGGSATRNIRKADRHGVTLREGRSIDDLRIFYDLHASLRKQKYGLFAQPFLFFEHLHAAFAKDDRIFVLFAEECGVPIAGIVFLVCGDTLYYKFNASSDASLRPNDLLVWHGMQLGRERGLTRLDFGLSDVEQPGLIRFKQKFATNEQPITELRWSVALTADDRTTEARRLLQKLTVALTSADVPDEVTQRVGDEVYRYFC